VPLWAHAVGLPDGDLPGLCVVRVVRGYFGVHVRSIEPGEANGAERVRLRALGADYMVMDARGRVKVGGW
jgi:hypothetical protein